MFKQWMILVGLLLPLAGCDTFSFLQDRTSQAVIPAKVKTEFHTPEAFTRIDVKGDVILNVHTGARRSWFSMHGDTRDLRNIEWKVKNTRRGETLRIRLDGRFPKHGPVTIDIGAHRLYALSYEGNGNVTGRHLYSPQLDLRIHNAKNTTTVLDGNLNLHHVLLQGAGDVQINGGGRDPNLDLILEERVHARISNLVSPRYIEMHGRSYLELPRVNSKYLRLNMINASSAQLRGTVQWAVIKLNGKAHFDGRKLTMKEAFVKTDGYAMALIYVTYKQHTLATGQSNIYYYHTPTYEDDFMGRSGSVLNLGAEKKSS